MTTYQQFPAPQPPFGGSPLPAGPRSRTADVVATSMLIAAHVGVFTLAAFFSLFFVMAADPCGSATVCNTGNITGAYVLTDLVGVIVVLASSTVAIVLMMRKKIAFWVPLIGVAVQVALVTASIGLLGNVVA